MPFDFAPASDGDIELESPWEDTPSNDQRSRDNEWARISLDFTNVSSPSFDWPRIPNHTSQAGYREGITAGKESSLQEGFDAGFSQVGVPLGRKIGILRGVTSALLAILNSGTTIDPIALAEVQDISLRLGEVRLSDVAPPDLEAEVHAREHLETYGEHDEEMDVVDGEIKDKRDLEQLEDMLSAFSTRESDGVRTRPTMDDVLQLQHRLDTVCQRNRLAVDLS